MAGFSQRLAVMVVTSAWSLPLVFGATAIAQSPRMRGPQPQQNAAPPAAQPQAASMPAMAARQPVNMLQEPAHEAQVMFTGDRLSIQAENASLAAILHQIATQSGMKITGLTGDERVFGTFGPAATRDVLEDLLNGTAYDQMLVGSASYGAPREMILTPAGRGSSQAQMQTSARPAPLDQSAPDDIPSDQDSQDNQPPPDVQPPANAVPSGVRTPQQLFQQLQQMRQAQQQQIPQQEQPQQPQQ